MPTETELESIQVRLKKNGDLVQRVDGSEVTVAHYDMATGRLEFSSREYSVKLYRQVTDRIGTVDKGTQPSGLVIKSIGIKDEPVLPSDSSVPPRPRMGPEGDGTPALVDWYVRHHLPEAIIRYGIYVDAHGKPLRKKVERTIEVRTDNRDGEEDQVPTPRKGQSYEGGPVKIRKVTQTARNAIIARRSTRLEDDPDVLADLGVDKLEALFLPQEVVGGFQPDDEFEQPSQPQAED